MPLKTSRSVPNDPGVASGDQNDRGDVLLVTKSLRFRLPGCGPFSGQGGDPGQSCGGFCTLCDLPRRPRGRLRTVGIAVRSFLDGDPVALEGGEVITRAICCDGDAFQVSETESATKRKYRCRKRNVQYELSVEFVTGPLLT